ncbi:MAG: hypothetical protein L0211_07790, partial [Planctomycetaceae bacterium]|nr:hypothetical protein [Planctomycetaceae bacterium]
MKRESILPLWLRNSRAKGGHRTAPISNRSARFRRLYLESLEDRCLLAARIWTGGGLNDLWSNPANWDGGVTAPTSGDAVVIPDTAQSSEVIFDNSVLGGAVSLSSLTSDEPFRISGATLALDGPGAFSFNNTLTISAGLLDGTGTLNVGGLTNWSGGLMAGAGVTNANGGLVMSGNLLLLDGRTLNNAAAATYNGVANNVLSNSSSTFNNLATGTFTIEGNNDLTGAGVSPSFNNLGRFIKRAGGGDGISRLASVFNNSGLVELQSGTLVLEGSGDSTGDFDAQIGTTLQFAVGGTHDFNAGADITVAGLALHAGTGTTNFNAGSSYTVSGTTQIINGTHNFNSTANTTTLLMTGGLLGGSGTFNVSGLTTWSGGPGVFSTMAGPGATNANGGLTMSGNLLLLDGRTLNNAGAATYNGIANNTLSVGSATFNNLATGTFTIDGNNNFLGAGPFAAFNNLGTVLKRAGAAGDGITSFTTAFNNSGFVDLQSGTLSLEGAFTSTSTGDFVTQAGTTLRFDVGGTHHFNAGADIAVAGLALHAGTGTTNFNAGSSYTISGATQVVSGTHNFNITANTASLAMTGGVLGGSGTFNVSGLTTWSGGAGLPPAMFGPGVTNANGGLTLTGNLLLTSGRTLNNAGVAAYNGGGNNSISIGSDSTFNNLATGTFTIDGNNDLTGAGVAPTFNNLGTFIKRTGATGDGITSFSTIFNSSGLLNLQNGTLVLERGTNAGAVTIGSGSIFTVNGTYAQTAGTTNLAGGTFSAAAGVQINGGLLNGVGTVSANVTNAGGVVSPGLSPGIFGVAGNYNQGAAGALNIEIGGSSAGTQFD